MLTRSLIPVLLAFVLVGGASAQTSEPPVWYEWIYQSKTVQQYLRGAQVCDSELPVDGVVGNTRIFVVKVGVWNTDGIGCLERDRFTCVSVSGCEIAIFTYTKNTTPRPVEMSSLTGLPKMTAVIDEYDSSPILVYSRSGSALIAMISTFLQDGLVKGIAITLVVLSLVYLSAQMVVQVLHENTPLGGSPDQDASGAAAGYAVNQHGSGYDGQE